MKKITWLLPLVVTTVLVSAQKKSDRKTLTNLQQHISYLSSDKLEGRLTGAPGEKLAAEYIQSQMQQIGLVPKGTDGFLQTFSVKEGREPAANCSFELNHRPLTAGTQYIPLPFTATKAAKGEVLPQANEPDNIWLINVAELDSTKFTSRRELYKRETAEAAKAGATGVIFFNGTESLPEINSWLETNETAASIPAVWVSKEISKILDDENANSFLIQLNVALKPVKRTGTNVIGYVDNKAARTVIIGAHYDHLGYGEDNNGLTKGKVLYHGANDNASGIAALLELARQIKASKLKNTNFLFVAFSGNEQSLSGSKYLTANSPIDLSQANYMLNLDMIGRLNTTHGLQIAGMGTSPSWTKLLENTNKETKVVYEASGVGNSDHTSFYRKQIPVLFFFTGMEDYHQPEDSADKINYEGTLTVMKVVFELIEKTDTIEKLAFTATPEPTTAAIK
ncbi:Peptidase family M28 [Chitinophaga jiangningensis]|uniref:Peptidase family M28 n=1 Tax=Chitinophaga jiangningensis TaxID=1419482 RepID=A0A1M7E8Q5_9BACT|nr:M20/M25/M40 family metallo-hydrolase [Chitinophaga jiangningensis]SHL88117.1 Peptidase family M28 [Chitinophaga jiangningensis]